MQGAVVIFPFLSLTDEEAMWRVREHGDSHAFERLVQRYEYAIQRLCTRMTGDPHRGEDLAQETFMRLFVHRKTYQPTARFKTFLWRIALNLCYDDLRRTKRWNTTSFDDDTDEKSAFVESLAESPPSPEVLLVEKERTQQVQRALSRLPEGYRAVVVLRHYEGLKFREIAEVLDIPQGTVKSRMAEALTRLARFLEADLKLET